MVDAREYHRRTNHSPASIRQESHTLDRRTKPRPYKEYESLPRVELGGIRPPQGPALSAITHSLPDPIAAASGSGAVDDWSDYRGPADERAMDLTDLATLCYESSGIVERATVPDGRQMHFRAASCTGKLYHIDLYLVVGDVAGLADGVYHFDPRAFALEVLREGDYRGVMGDAVGEVEASHNQGSGRNASDSPVREAPVTVVATSTWWRNAWKYRERTYRHAFWDSGTVVANLLAAAHAMDHRACLHGAFADGQLVELLGLDPGWEAPIAMVSVGSGSGDSEVDAGRLPDDVSPIDPDTVPPSPDWTEYPLIVEAWEQSRLDDGPAVAEWRADAVKARGTGTVGPGAGGDGGDGDEGSRIDFEPVEPEVQSRRPLAATIRRRRSCRNYDSEGPTKRQVATVLHRATRGVPADWNLGGDSDDAEAWTVPAFNDVYLLMTDVEDVPDGVYQYHPGNRTVERLGETSVAEKRHLALNQGWAGQAHVNVYLLADVDRIVETLGNRGYRIAQLEAGVVLGRLYLATYAHRDLGGTGLTFFDEEVREALSPGANGQTPTCLFAFGTAAT